MQLRHKTKSTVDFCSFLLFFSFNAWRKKKKKKLAFIWRRNRQKLRLSPVSITVLVQRTREHTSRWTMAIIDSAVRPHWAGEMNIWFMCCFYKEGASTLRNFDASMLRRVGGMAVLDVAQKVRHRRRSLGIFLLERQHKTPNRNTKRKRERERAKESERENGSFQF